MTAFKAKFNVKDLGSVAQLLGMGITRTATTLEMSMAKGIVQMAAKYGVLDAVPVKTPMEVGCDNTLSMDQDKDIKYPFRELLGELMWVCRIGRPDALFAAKVLSRYTNCYTEIHFKALKRVVKYLHSTKHLSLTFRKQPDFNPAKLSFSLYTDADYGGDRMTRRSVSGWQLFMCGNPIQAGSVQQKTVALSTTESELMSLTEGLKDVLFAHQLTEEFTGVDYPTRVHVDNQGTKALAQNDVTSGKTKHIAIRYFFVRDLVKDGSITLGFVPTNDNIADLMTKALPEPAHTRLTKAVLGLH
jgi:hypothetical protein